MSYTTSYSIERVFSVPEKVIEGKTYNNLLIKIIAKCDIVISETGEEISLPLTINLPAPKNVDYIDIEDITQTKLIEWVKRTSESKVVRLVEKRTLINSRINQTASTTEEISLDRFS